jgi:hypothetical protein
LRVLPEFGCDVADSVECLRYPNSYRPAANAARSIRLRCAGTTPALPPSGGRDHPLRVMRTGLNAETLGRQQDHTKGTCRRYRRASAISAYGPPPESKSYLNESET